MTITTTPIREERWTKNGATAVVEVEDKGWRGEVVIVTYDVLKNMLTDLGFEQQGTDDYTI